MLPCLGELVRERGHRDQQRAPCAARAQGPRPAGRGPRRHPDHLSSWPGGWAHGWGYASCRGGWDELRLLSPMHRGMSYGGWRSSAASSGRATSEDAPGRAVPARAAVGGAGRAARGRRSCVVEHELPVDELDDDFPIRLTTGRRLDSYNTGVQTGGYASPLRRPETLDLSPEDCERLGVVEGERCRSAPGAAGSIAPGARRPRPAARAGLHDAALPRPGRHQRPDDRRHRPAVGHGRVQGGGDPGREAAPSGVELAPGHETIPAA